MRKEQSLGFQSSKKSNLRRYQSEKVYGTAQFKLDICMRVLVQSFEKFVMELASFLRAHNPWHAFDPRDELYAHEVRSSVAYFTREQSCYV